VVRSSGGVHYVNIDICTGSARVEERGYLGLISCPDSYLPIGDHLGLPGAAVHRYTPGSIILFFKKKMSSV